MAPCRKCICECVCVCPAALQQCDLGELVCEVSPGCVPLQRRCDRSTDCLPFHSDESSCHGNALSPSVPFRSSVPLKHIPLYDFSTPEHKRVLERPVDFYRCIDPQLLPSLMSICAFNVLMIKTVLAPNVTVVALTFTNGEQHSARSTSVMSLLFVSVNTFD